MFHLYKGMVSGFIVLKVCRRSLVWKVRASLSVSVMRVDFVILPSPSPLGFCFGEGFRQVCL